MKRIIECVPNFSEGKDINIIKLITSEIENTEGVILLDVDPGIATNRTVVTFVGEPEQVIEAAFKAIKKASELIDMRHHKGEHPRMGATDVCPLVPISGVTMEETVEFARILAKRIGEELAIPIYCYEEAAIINERRNLAHCRSGEYEGLQKKLSLPEWKPDFGPSEFNARSGVTAVGARDFLVAYNVNLNTTSTRRANAIAFDIREKGRPKREGNQVVGKIVKDDKGETVFISGTLKAVKAIGWFIEEYGIAQVSINLTNINITPLHIAFEECIKKADERGVRVTGSELVGLVPKKVLIDAGKYFLNKQKRSLGVTDEEIIRIAVKSLGLDELKPFNYKEKVIEYLLENNDDKKLINMSCKAFADETASESAAPGGGSISAYCGVLGISLATMVANLSSHKPGWDERWEEFSYWAVKGQALKEELLHLVDEDTNAFNRIMNAFGLPKDSESEKVIRTNAIQEATKYATEIPFKVMKTSFATIEIIKAMVELGNPNSITDAGVGALCARTAIMGAYLNVKINASGLKDLEFSKKVINEGLIIQEQAQQLEKEIIETVNQKIS